jgi:ribosomal protein S18 acetylase RimI-like enzyme
VSPLRAEQVEAAVALLAAQLQEHRIEPGLDEMRAALRQVLADGRLGFVLGASLADGNLVGVAYGCAFLGLEHRGLSGWLEELYVHPAWRGRRIGAGLLEEFIRTAANRGWRAIDLEVDADHRQTVSLYERHGFRPHSRSRFYLKLTS